MNGYQLEEFECSECGTAHTGTTDCPGYGCDNCGDCEDCDELRAARAEDRYDDDEDGRMMFADPGGRSALRASSASNPRDLPCPNCERPNRLTRADRAAGYQCDTCADQAEMGGGY